MNPKVFTRSLLPPLSVHTWGGFGSQLFALVVATRLSKVFPYRRIRIVFHSSGVTKRKRELPSPWLKDFLIAEVDDYVHSTPNDLPSLKRRMTSILIIFRNVIKSLGILAELDFEEDFEHLKFPILEVRGHYTGISIKEPELYELRKLIFEDSLETPTSNCISVHYRLGDLMETSSKTYINPSRIALAISTFNYIDKIIVYSDSIEATAIDRLRFFLDGKSLNLASVGAIETIAGCVQCQVFIGTNSKISIWIALLRLLTGNSGHTLLPMELHSNLAQLLHRLPNGLLGIRFY